MISIIDWTGNRQWNRLKAVFRLWNSFLVRLKLTENVHLNHIEFPNMNLQNNHPDDLSSNRCLLNYSVDGFVIRDGTIDFHTKSECSVWILMIKIHFQWLTWPSAKNFSPNPSEKYVLNWSNLSTRNFEYGSNRVQNLTDLVEIMIGRAWHEDNLLLIIRQKFTRIQSFQ